MRLVTIQASAFKSTFETLKDILNDVNIFFRPDGVSMCTLDVARTSLVDLFLAKENFEEYECDEEEIICGVNIANTFKLFKTITNTDVLTLSIPPGGKEYLHIEISSEAKKQSSKFDLKLLDIDESRIEVPEIPNDQIVSTTLPSTDFQRLCRDMSNIGSEIAIARKENVLKLQCEGDFANQETSIETCERIDRSFSGTYSLRYLNIFTKATAMCSTVSLMQETNNRFLILKYNVANLGELKFYLASKQQG